MDKNKTKQNRTKTTWNFIYCMFDGVTFFSERGFNFKATAKESGTAFMTQFGLYEF